MNTLFEKWQIEQDIQDRYPTDILSFMVAPAVTAGSKLCKVCRELLPSYVFVGKLKGEYKVCKSCLTRKVNLRDDKLSYLDKKWIKHWLREGFLKGQIAQTFKVSLYIVNKVSKGV